MGLIRAVLGAAGSVMADQWKEFFYYDAFPPDVLVVKAKKRTNGNNKGNDNIITNGSGIAVADGQCAIIVDQGRVVEICAVPGEYTYDMSSEPSLFSGSLGEGIKQTFKAIGKRIAYGGDTGKDQRVYYFNLKEIRGNKFGTPRPVPFRVVDEKIGLDVDITVRCNGEYSYTIKDPISFYTNVCGNVPAEFRRTELDNTLKSEFLNALQPAFARISAMGIRYSAVPGHTMELSDSLNEILSEKWGKTRGLQVESISINTISASEEDEQMIKEAQREAQKIHMRTDPNRAAAALVSAQEDAMRNASKAGAGMGSVMGFMGMNMAQQQGGMNAQDLFAMGQQQRQGAAAQAVSQPSADTWICKCGAAAAGKFCPECGSPRPAAGGWTCKCGAAATGKFCPECGSPKPAEDGWTCSCGTVNKGKFCQNCGGKKPEGAPLYRCDKCGWEPADPAHPPKFCPECGDPFDEKDVK